MEALKFCFFLFFLWSVCLAGQRRVLAAKAKHPEQDECEPSKWLHSEAAESPAAV